MKPAFRVAIGPFPSLKRWTLSLTASASNGSPSVNVTSVRRFIVSTVLSSLYSQSVASIGSNDPSGIRRTSVSYGAW